MVLEQIRVGSDNFCYVVSCPVQKKAAVVDPGFDAAKAVQFLEKNHLILGLCYPHPLSQRSFSGGKTDEDSVSLL